MRARVKYHSFTATERNIPYGACVIFGVSRSGYYSFLRRQGRPEHDAKLAELIRAHQAYCKHTYGYRRIWIWLKNTKGINRNPKTIPCIMKKYELLAEIRRIRKWTQMGQQVHKYENLLNRQFHADRPNQKWVTDISYIHTKQVVLYLSMIRDLFDNSAVAGELQLHSDQGFQYTSQAYFDLTQEYGITPSMSRRGNCYDNAMAKNFFAILKTECIYRQELNSFEDARKAIDDFIFFYNHERIQTKNGVAPLALRHST